MFYKRLFELNIFHGYYRDKICPDLIIEPTTKCSKILSGHRLIIKNKINGIEVIAPVDSDNKPWIELTDNLHFTFILKLKNQDFIDFTDIKWNPIDNGIYQFSNDNNTQTGVVDSDVPGLEMTQTLLCDLKLPRGQNIFGIVDIYNNSSMEKILNQGSQFKITFNAKQQKWYYYLLTDIVSNCDEFLIKIKDQDNIEDTGIKFSKILNTGTEKTDPIFSILQKQFPKSQLHIFKSNNKIVCRETGVENVQLLKRKNNECNTETVWIEHLPNPPNRNGIQIINALKYL